MRMYRTGTSAYKLLRRHATLTANVDVYFRRISHLAAQIGDGNLVWGRAYFMYLFIRIIR